MEIKETHSHRYISCSTSLEQKEERVRSQNESTTAAQCELNWLDAIGLVADTDRKLVSINADRTVSNGRGESAEGANGCFYLPYSEQR